MYDEFFNILFSLQEATKSTLIPEKKIRMLVPEPETNVHEFVAHMERKLMLMIRTVNAVVV